MSTSVTAADLWDTLETLAEDLESTRIRVPSPREQAGDGARRSLLADIRRYFGPRLGAPGAPLVIAVVGPSGVGVSTVVNALAGEFVSATGVLRPTTRAPRIWAPHAARGRWWQDMKARLGTADADVVIGGPDTADRGWMIVDVPAAIGPSESLDLAACADLCIFINSPSRYADAEAAALALGLFERGVPTWYALNKLPEDAALRFQIGEAYAGLLQAWSLLGSASHELIDTAHLSADGLIGAGDLPRLRGRLDSIAEPESRRRLLEDAIAARLAAVSVRSEEVAERIEDDRDLLMDLDTMARDAYTDEAGRLVEDLDSGGLAGLADHSSWPEAAVDLTGIVTRRSGLAAHNAAEAWDATPAGRAVLAEGGGALRRHGEQAAFDGQGLLEAWVLELGDLAAAAIAPRRVSSRKRARLANQLWPLIVDPERSPPRRLGRRLGAKVDEVVGEARLRLGSTMVAAVAHDADRFDEFLGPPPDVARLGRILTTASVLGAIEPAGLDAPPGPGWGDDDAQSRLDLEIVIDADAPVANGADATAELVGATVERSEALAGADSDGLSGSATPPFGSASGHGGEEADGHEGAPSADAGDAASNGIVSSSLPEVPVFELPEVPPPPPPHVEPATSHDVRSHEGESAGQVEEGPDDA